MRLTPLPFRSSLDQYQMQAGQLLEGHRSGDADAIRIIHENHPRFLDSKIVWLPKDIPDSEIQSAEFTLADAQRALARWYSFESWGTLGEHVEAVTRDRSPTAQFESAVEAVVTGDAAALETLLREHPELVRARSTRVTHQDPPVHRATLLHYIAANGVESYRQKTPQNAVEIARTLLENGADPNALADMYGEPCTTMSMLASSSPPAEAGVQVALVELLVDFGASVEARDPATKWGSPVMTALVFGFRDAAEALVRRGARVDTLAVAAGLGRQADAARLLPDASPEERHRALALATQLGHAGVVQLLLDSGEDPNRFNPVHSHTMPLHQAAMAGHLAVVRLLVERGARLDIKDTIHKGTPLGWAMYGGQKEVERYLREHGAKTTAELMGPPGS